MKDLKQLITEASIERSMERSILSKIPKVLKDLFGMFFNVYRSINRKVETWDSMVHHTNQDKSLSISTKGYKYNGKEYVESNEVPRARFEASYMTRRKLDKLFDTFENEAKKLGWKTVRGVVNEGEGFDEVRYIYLQEINGIENIANDEYEITFKNAIEENKLKKFNGTPFMICGVVYGYDFNRYNMYAYGSPELCKVATVIDNYTTNKVPSRFIYDDTTKKIVRRKD